MGRVVRRGSGRSQLRPVLNRVGSLDAMLPDPTLRRTASSYRSQSAKSYAALRVNSSPASVQLA